MGYGNSYSRSKEDKRVIADQSIGPLIATNMDLCIHCTRCVRFGEEVSGVRELGALGRGEDMQIGTFIEKNVTSELSGNVIDLCPVGALTSKPARHKGRSWEYKQTPTISPHDPYGTNLYVHSLRDQLIRVVPMENNDINENWIPDRDRFSYLGSSKHRIETPMLKKDKGLEPCSWEEALQYLSKKCHQTAGTGSVGCLLSSSATIEEQFLLSKILSQFPNNACSTDRMLIDQEFKKYLPKIQSLGTKIKDLNKQKVIILVGVDLKLELPLLSIRLRQAIQQDCKIYVFNLEATKIDLECEQIIVKDFIDAVNSFPKLVSSTDNLCILGQNAMMQSNYAKIYQSIACYCDQNNLNLGTITAGANSATSELLFKDNLEFDAELLLMFGVELKDYLCQDLVLNKIKSAKTKILFSSFLDHDLIDYADLVLPLATHFETSGSYINIDAKIQSWQAAIAAKGQSKPGWKILRVLGNHLGISNFDYETSFQILKEFKDNYLILNIEHKHDPKIKGVEFDNMINANINTNTMYTIDSLVRRSQPLQEVFND
jgi:NADH-quinone oxidoreductase subunit G